jgi:hypothetical protein
MRKMYCRLYNRQKVSSPDASPSLADPAAGCPLRLTRLYEEIFEREATFAALQWAAAAQTSKLAVD